MQPRKPLSEYTVAGLLFVGAKSDDAVIKSAIIVELRNRRAQADARKEAAALNRAAKGELKTELEIEGLRSRDEQTRRKANRDLFAAMKDRAFEIVDIPDGLTPGETVKRYNRDIHDRAVTLYREYKRECKKGAITERRLIVERGRKVYAESRRAYRTAKRLEQDTYQSARFPLVGREVYYADTTHGDRCVGRIQGFSFQADISAFRIRIAAPGGGIVKRTFSVIEPVSDAEWFNEVKAAYMEFERMERIVRERDGLIARAGVIRNKVDELTPVVDEYLRSDFRRDWLAADEVAADFAREARGMKADETPLF